LRRWLAAAALVFLLEAASPALADSVYLTAEPVALDPHDPSLRRIGSLDFLAGFVLNGHTSQWGGWSGLTISPDGRMLTAISDVGSWLVLDLRHDPSGRLTGIGAAAMWPVLDRQGRPVESKSWADAEALARDRDGSLLVAFERLHRVWRYPRDVAGHALPVAVDAPAAILKLPANTGIEAMTVLGDGTILLISENGLHGEADIAGWVGRPGAWSRLNLARSGSFTVSDATLLPSGDVLLLERDFSLLGAAALVRLSVVPRAAIRPGARLVSHTLAELAPPQTVDNFEAAAARTAPDGATLIYLMSDDNQSFLQRTLLFQLRLEPAAPVKAAAGSP
jgi:hypothetical protein